MKKKFHVFLPPELASYLGALPPGYRQDAVREALRMGLSNGPNKIPRQAGNLRHGARRGRVARTYTIPEDLYNRMRIHHNNCSAYAVAAIAQWVAADVAAKAAKD